MDQHPAVHAQPVTKFEPPRLRTETVVRDRHVERLRSSEAPLVLVTGAAGSGKSILLAQWHSREPNAVWMSLDRMDNDPVVFWSSLIDGLDRAIKGVGAQIRRTVIAGEGLTVDGAIGAVVNALAERGQPCCIFFDDAHLLDNDDLAASIPLLAQRLPSGHRVIVASRSRDTFRLAKLRLSGQLAEVDASSLAMSDAEAGELFAGMGIELASAQVAAFNRRAEGWVAGLILAGQLLKRQPDGQVAADQFDGSDRDVAEYLIEEVIQQLPPDDRAFLVRTSILSRFTGDLCDAVSGLAGGAQRLERLERANAFVVPLDRQRRWYRYHHLFSDLLSDLLGRQHSDEVDELHRRASRWFGTRRMGPEAIDHALAGGMRIDAAVLLARHWYDLANAGQIMTARRLLNQFEADEIMAFQPLALTAAWVKGVVGDPGAAELLAVAENGDYRDLPPDGSATMESAVALARSVFGWQGVARSLADAELAYALEPPGSRWRSMAAWLVADRHIWGDDWAAAKPFLDEVANGATDQGNIRALAFAMLALWHLDRGETSTATDMSEIALRLVEDTALGDVVTAGSVFAVRARVAQATGDDATAQASLDAARGPVGRSEGALPLGGIHAKVLLAEAALTIGDLVTALESVERATAVAARIGDTGALTDHLDRVRWGIAEATGVFSARELDVIWLLPTDLTSHEICETLFVSRNTLKSHLRRIYRKLGVSSRGAAVEEVRRMGLVPPRTADPTAAAAPDEGLEVSGSTI